MIRKSKFHYLSSVLLLLLMMMVTTTSVFAANGWDENTHQSLTNIWEKYSIREVPCGGTFRPDATCNNQYSCPSCGRKCDICGPVRCDRCSGTGRHMGWCYSCSIWHSSGFDAVHHSDKYKGNLIGTVSSTTTNAYPSNGIAGDYWYVYLGRATDTVAPTLSLSKSTDANSPSYTGQNVTVTANATDNLSGVQGYSWNGGALSASSTYIVTANTGQTTVTCKVKDNAGNWSSVQSISVKTITNQPNINISVSNSTVVYGDSVNVSATGGATSLGNNFLYEITGGKAEFSNGSQSITSSQPVRLTPRNIGRVTVRVTKKGNASYYDKTATVSVTATQKTITVSGTLSFHNKVYDGNTNATVKQNGLALNGIVFNDNVVLSAPVGVFANKNVGQQQISVREFSVSGSDVSKYIFTKPTIPTITANITPKTLTVTNGEIRDKVYDENTSATYVSSPTLVGVVAGDSISCAGGVPSFENKDIGRDKNIIFADFILSGTDARNYTLTKPTGIKADITAKEITIKDYAIKDKIYDGNMAAEFVTVPTIDGNFIGVNLVQGRATFDNKNVGTNKAVALAGFSLAGENAKNFVLNIPTNATGTITKKPLKVNTFQIATKVYDGNATASIKADERLTFDGLVNSNEDVDLTIGTLAFEDKNAGKRKTVIARDFAITGTDAKNYTLIQPKTAVTLKGDILPKELSILNVEVKNKVYDETTSAEFVSSPRLVGVVSGDTIGCDIGVPSFENKDIGRDKNIIFTDFTLTGAGATNYHLIQPTGITADITAKEITIKDYAIKDKIYDGNTVAEFVTAPTIDGKFMGVKLVKGTATFDNKTVGTNKPVALAGFSLAGENAKNFVLNIPTNATGTITKKPLKVNTFQISTKVYDGNTTAQIKAGETLTFDGLVNSKEDVDLTIGTLAFEDKNAGKRKTVIARDFAITGTDAKNYTLIQPRTAVTLKGDILPKELTVTNITAKDKVYDGTTKAEYKSNPALVGVVDGDTVSLQNGSIAFADKIVGDAKTVVYGDFVITDTNYTLTQPKSTTAKILKKELALMDFTIKNKVYDSNTTAEFQVAPALDESTIVKGDDVNISSYKATFENKNVGTNKPIIVAITLSGKDVKNYAFENPTDKTATITQKPITVVSTAIVDREYNADVNTAFVNAPKLDGLIGKDDVTLVVPVPTYENANVARDKTVLCKDFQLAGTDAQNYALTQPALTGTVIPKLINIKVNDAKKVYGEKDPVFTMNHDKLYGDDEIVGSIGRVKGEDVGTYQYVVGSLTAGNNYRLKVNTTERFEITRGETSLNLNLRKDSTVPTYITVRATVSDETDGKIEFYLNGRKATTKKVTNNEASFVFKPLKPGYYSINAKLTESSNFNDCISDIVDFSVTDRELGLNDDKDSNTDKDHNEDCPNYDKDGDKDKDNDKDKNDHICNCQPQNTGNSNGNGNAGNNGVNGSNGNNGVNGNNSGGNGNVIRPPANKDEINAVDKRDSLTINIYLNKLMEKADSEETTSSETEEEGNTEKDEVLENINPELVVIEIAKEELTFTLPKNGDFIGAYNAKLYLGETEIEPYDEVTVTIPLKAQQEQENLKAIFSDGTQAEVSVLGNEMVFTSEQLGDFVVVSDSGFSLVAVLGGFLVVAILVVAAYYLYKKYRENKAENHMED